VPKALVLKNPNFRAEMIGFDPPHGTYIHINGTGDKCPTGTYSAPAPAA
jgi:uncharacterized circularly permuted ATP-grasp superfamily protein